MKLKFLTLCILTLTFLMSISGVAYAAVTFTVNTFVDAPDANLKDGVCKTAAGKCSLRAAIQQSARINTWVEIKLLAGTYTLTQTGIDEDFAVTGDLDVTRAVRIRGKGVTKTFINGGGIDRIFHVFDGPLGDGAELQLSKLTLTNGYASTYGGGVLVEGIEARLGLFDSYIDSNNATLGGGGIASVDGGYLDLGFSEGIVSNFTNNTAPIGGAIYILRANGSIRNALFSNNNAQLGGAIAADEMSVSTRSTELMLNNSNLVNNHAACLPLDLVCTPSDVAGGAIYLRNNADFEGEYLTIDSNTSTGFGGGLASHKGSGLLSFTTLSQNQAHLMGGGIFAYQHGFSLNMSSIWGNSVTMLGIDPRHGSGGGIAVDQASVRLTDSTLYNNSAVNDGGGYYIYSSENVIGVPVSQVIFTTIAGNTATDSGGGVYADVGGLVSYSFGAYASIIADNTATTAPDCASNLSNSVTIRRSLLENPTGCNYQNSNFNLYNQDPFLGTPSYGMQGKTLALYPMLNSPVIDAVLEDCISTTDQHRNDRETSEPCTMGAIEPNRIVISANNSFEDGLTGWIVKSNDGQDKVSNDKAFSGLNSFLFTAKTGKTATLKQTLIGSAIPSFEVGDSLMGYGVFGLSPAATGGASMRLTLTYSDGTKVKANIAIKPSTSGLRDIRTKWLVITLPSGRTVTSIELLLTSKVVNGQIYKLYGDNIGIILKPVGASSRSLSLRDGAGILSLPDALDGFRNGN